MLLNLWGHEPSFASDGTAGLAKALAERPDVALVDIGLPGLDGYELARRVRASAEPWSSQVMLIALTGYGQASDIDRARAAGFNRHLLKPVDPVQLEVLLEAVATQGS
jgi:two-component system, sensor histidine kinase